MHSCVHVFLQDANLPSSCARTIGEFLSKQEARTGPKPLNTREQTPITHPLLRQHVAPLNMSETARYKTQRSE